MLILVSNLSAPWRAGAIQLRSGHEIYIARPEKQAVYCRYMLMEYEVRSMKYKACSRDMHME